MGREWAYNAASNSGNQTGGQLVLNRNRNCREALGGVADDREQDKTNELFRDRAAASQSIDRMDKPFGSDADKGRDYNEKTDGHWERQLWYFFILLSIIGLSRTTSTGFLSGEGPGRFLRPVLRARPDAESVFDRLRFVNVLVIIQPLMGKELKNKV